MVLLTKKNFIYKDDYKLFKTDGLNHRCRICSSTVYEQLIYNQRYQRDACSRAILNNFANIIKLIDVGPGIAQRVTQLPNLPRTRIQAVWKTKLFIFS